MMAEGGSSQGIQSSPEGSGSNYPIMQQQQNQLQKQLEQQEQEDLKITD